MTSGINPGRVDVKFGVSGPIDGPSAGGILTVGVLAALLGAPIRGDMTMTGTISPDGSIGPVGGIDLKLQAAADQGYRTVLLPIANMNVRTRETDQVESAAEVGRRLGLEVIPVGNVQQAFTKFTDGKFAYPAAPAFVLPGNVQELTATQTTTLLALLRDQAGKVAAGETNTQIMSLLTIAEDAANNGDNALAYGVGMLALNMANREVASATAQSTLASAGLAGATTWLRDWTAKAAARNSALLEASARAAATLGYEQQLTLPNALSWLTYNDAILQSVQQRLDAGPLAASDVDRFARVLADVDVAIETCFPDQLAIVRAAPAKASPGASVVASYLSDYRTFLVRAGQAQQDYVQQVIMRGQDPVEFAKQNDIGLLLPTVLNLSNTVADIPPGLDSLPDEVVEVTTAITYYIATTSLISSLQDFGISEFGIGAEPTQSAQTEVMNTSVATAAKAVDEVSALLGQRGLDASLPVWAASYGRAASDA
ncbi:MAG: S16 family serine protease, partial [Actinomycetales bacterium]